MTFKRLSQLTLLNKKNSVDLINSYDNLSSRQRSTAPHVQNVGGEMYESGGYIYHAFTANTTLTLCTNTFADILMVGGGGPGGKSAGAGGGAGGVVYLSSIFLPEGDQTIIVGEGGAPASGYGNGYSPQRSNTYVISAQNTSYFAYGGGVGQSNYNWTTSGDGPAGSVGGSGGGRASKTAQTGYAALQPTSALGGLGNKGGNSVVSATYGCGGGGGGAGAAGGNATATAGGAGGAGTSAYSDILTIVNKGVLSGGLRYIAGGGGGYGESPSQVAATGGGGAGGIGGGGASLLNPNGSQFPFGYPGTPNTGGGGGCDASGGSGLVVIRYNKEYLVQRAR